MQDHRSGGDGDGGGGGGGIELLRRWKADTGSEGAPSDGCERSRGWERPVSRADALLLSAIRHRVRDGRNTFREVFVLLRKARAKPLLAD
ncbi:hypothetical protein CMUS01_06921 [Colletotrichum musicola]|uniref:Uncharacterized protein n=1 Tax=Colletotrichum musicola TaxID=2175873 RepID=A0A8H6NGD4_9PEZI|nr:hypothetical protein CMUS01_06921 [Colletotrichum musicola]